MIRRFAFILPVAMATCLLFMRDRPAPKWRCPSEFTAAECSTLSAMRLPAALPQPVSNSVADQPRAAMLGFEMFYDARFSRENRVRCASCHLPELTFADGKAVAVGGIHRLKRNSPSLLTSAWMRTQFWDARTQDLSLQPLQPLMHPDEMGFDLVSLYLRLQKTYRTRFESVFGEWPVIPRLAAQDPDLLKPAALRVLQTQVTASERTILQRVAEHWADAMESYMRKIAARDAPLDEWLDGDRTGLAPEAVRGARLFLKRGCVNCHSGFAMTDEKLHDIKGLGRFRTPSLRNVVATGPYMHDGSSPTLQDAIFRHASDSKLSSTEMLELSAFLETLVGKYPETPWNNWPAR